MTTWGNAMKRRWFVPAGWLYRPVTLVGWLVTLAALIYMLQVFVAIDARAHSVSDMLYAL
jgi:hypothetical protein